MAKIPEPTIVLSSDTLSGYGLDLIFEIAKNVWFDGIDLATWKNYDARNEKYVAKLATKHELPVKVVQVSPKLNAKEMEQAFDLCDALDVKVVSMNAPTTFNFSSYNFITTNIKHYHDQQIQKNFAIINPAQKSIAWLIPKYRFANIVDIVKKYKTQLALDIANLDEETLETHFFRKAKQFIPYISVVYLSDKTRSGKWHVPPGEWSLKIPQLLKIFAKEWYHGLYSVKIDISKKDLSDVDKVELILEKTMSYIREQCKKAYENIE